MIVTLRIAVTASFSGTITTLLVFRNVMIKAVRVIPHAVEDGTISDVAELARVQGFTAIP